MAFKRHPTIAPLFVDIPGLYRSGVQWGIARVDYYGFERTLYEPQVEGAALAFIVPVVEAGELIDLAAIDGTTEHVGQRLGHGRGLGFDALERARQRCCDLVIVERPLQWLQRQHRAILDATRWKHATSAIEKSPDTTRALEELPADFVYLFNLAEVRVAFDDVPKIICESIEMWERVRSLLPKSQRERVVVLA